MKKNIMPLVGALSVVWLAHMIVDFMIGIWAVYKTIAGLDLALAGLIAGAAAFIGEGMQGIFGPMTDQGYRQRLLIFGLIAAAASTLLAYTDNYFLLFVLFLMTCMGSGAFHPAAVSFVNELSEQRKALFMTIFQSGGALGLAFGQLIFSQVFFLLEGHTFFLAIPGFLLIGAVLWVGVGYQPVVNVSSRKKITWSLFKRFFSSKELSCLYVSLLCNQAVFWGAIFMLPDVLKSRGYEDWICYGGAHLFLIIGGALMMVPAGYLADKYSCRSVIIGTFLVSVVSFYAFLSMPMMEPGVLCLLLFVLGAALGTVSPVAIALGNRLSPSNPGVVSACLMGLVWCVAEGIGQGGGGLLTKLFSEEPAASALACLGTLFLVGLTATLFLPAVEKDLELELISA